MLGMTVCIQWPKITLNCFNNFTYDKQNLIVKFVHKHHVSEILQMNYTSFDVSPIFVTPSIWKDWQLFDSNIFRQTTFRFGKRANTHRGFQNLAKAIAHVYFPALSSWRPLSSWINAVSFLPIIFEPVQYNGIIFTIT